MPGETWTADVGIVGAGPGGSSLAALLAGRGLDVLLVDRAHFPRDKTCGDGLTPRAIPVLERLGVLAQLDAAGYRRILAAELHPAGGEPWTVNFADYPLGMPPYGLVVQRFELDHILLRNALARGARFLPGFYATTALRDGAGGPVRGVSGALEDEPAAVHARVTVLAVGANTGLLRAFGLIDKMPPGINAIRGYFAGCRTSARTSNSTSSRNLRPATRGSSHWPMAARTSALDWSLAGRARIAATRASCWPNSWRAGRGCATLGLPGPLKGFPLQTDFPTYRPGGGGFVLVGEALGLVNPVTGEGIDLALESAELAAPVIAAALAANDITWRSLAPYGQALAAQSGSFFGGVKVLVRLATGPAAIRVLTRKAKKKPRPARPIAGINLGVVSPWQAFSPLIWWDILT